MSMWTAKNKELSYDQAKEDAKKAEKDVRLVSALKVILRPIYINLFTLIIS